MCENSSINLGIYIDSANIVALILEIVNKALIILIVMNV